MTAGNQNRSYYPALDGLRGIAILLVVFYHNFGFINYFFFGWLGVDLFFVLSGFLITDILLNTVGQPGFLRNFYVRRVLRIFPLYYLSLILFLLLLPLLTPSLNLDYYIKHQAWLWTYLQNWLYIFKPPPENTEALNHLWSLAVEEQFYLLWPLVILLLRNPKHILYLLVVLLIGVVTLRFVFWTYKLEDLAYYNLYTFSRIDGICIGSMLAVLRRINPKSINRYFTIIVLALAVLNFVFYFFNRENRFSYPYLAIAGYTTFAIIFGLLVNEGVERDNPLVNRLFSIPLLKFFGMISYSLYVFHWPLYLLTSRPLENWFLKNQPGFNAPIAASITATAMAVLLAWLSFRFFESRFLVLKKRFE